MSNYTSNNNPTVPQTPPPPPPQYAPPGYYYQPPVKRTNAGLIIGIVLGAIVLVGIVLLLVLDPFGLFNAGPKAVASAAPADSDFFMTVNLSKLMEDDAVDTILAFANAADSSIRSKEDLLDNLDDAFDEYVDMTFTGDIQPWVGQYVGISLKGISDPDYFSDGTIDFSMSVQIRNTSKADSFLEDFISNLEDMQDYDFDNDEYKGVDLNVGTNGSGEKDLIIARTGKLMIIASTMDAIEDAIDAQKGESMADNKDYLKLSQTLDSSSAVFVFSDLGALMSVVEENIDFYHRYVNLDILVASAASLSFVEDGVALDSAVLYDPDELTTDQIALLEAGGGFGDLAMNFPRDTLLIMGGNHLDMAWDAYRDLIVDTIGSDFDSSMEMFEDMVGFNLDTDLLPLMTGEYAIGIFPSREGMLSEMAEVNLGGMAIFTTSNGNQIYDYANDVEDVIYESGMAVEKESNPFDIWTVIDPYSEVSVISYGVRDAYLVISTNVNEMEDTFARNSSLMDSKFYKLAISAFGNDLTPFIYINFSDGLEYMADQMSSSESESLDALKPIQAIIGGVAKMKNNMTHSRILILIDK